MRSLQRWGYLAQILASLCLAIAYFLPFHTTAAGDVRRAGEWGLFFWAIPAIIIIYLITNRWLKAVFCVLASLSGSAALFLLTFLATFKSTPLVGFYIARASIILLILSWLVLCVITFRTAGDRKAKIDEHSPKQ